MFKLLNDIDSWLTVLFLNQSEPLNQSGHKIRLNTQSRMIGLRMLLIGPKLIYRSWTVNPYLGKLVLMMKVIKKVFLLIALHPPVGKAIFKNQMLFERFRLDLVTSC